MAPSMKLFAEADSLAARKILATAKSAGLSVEIAGPSKGVTPTGTGIAELLYHPAAKPVRHTNAIMRRVAQTADCGLLGKTFEDESVIDAWMDWAGLDVDHSLRLAGATPDKCCTILESHLKNRTFLVSERLSLADIAVAVSLQQAVETKGISEVKKSFPATVRWIQTCIDQLQLSPAPKSEAKPGQQTNVATGKKSEGKQAPAPKAAPKAEPKAAPKAEPKGQSNVAAKESKGATPDAIAMVARPTNAPLRKKVPKMQLYADANSQAAKKILATAKLIGLTIDVSGASSNTLVCGSPVPELVIAGGTPVKHTNAILRHIARLNADCELMGETFGDESLVDAWMDWSLLEVDHKLTIANAPMDKFYKVLEQHLKSRTFLVGERITVADVVVAVSLQPALEKTAVSDTKKTYPAMMRWWNTCACQLNIATPKTESKGSSAPSSKEAKVAKGTVTDDLGAPCWGEKLIAAPVKLFAESGSSVAKRILVIAKRVGLPVDIVGAAKNTTPSGLPIPELISGDSKPIRHVNPILRHIAQVVPDCDLLGLSFTQEAQIDAWLEWTVIEVDHAVACRQSVDSCCGILDSHLKNRAFLVGDSGLTLADIAVAIAVHDALKVNGTTEAKKSYPALDRWLRKCAHQLELN